MGDVILQNWYFFLPLALFSVVSLGLALEKAWVVWGKPDLTEEEYRRAVDLVASGVLPPPPPHKKSPTGPLAQLLEGFASLDSQGREDPTLKVTSLAQQLLDPWKSRLELFSHIANLSTLTGLFGTVTGMIWSFAAIQSAGSADPAVVAGGISQALITTFAGLAVALPSLLFHGYFSFLMNRKADQLEVLSSEFLSYYFHRHAGNSNGSGSLD